MCSLLLNQEYGVESMGPQVLVPLGPERIFGKLLRSFIQKDPHNYYSKERNKILYLIAFGPHRSQRGQFYFSFYIYEECFLPLILPSGTCLASFYHQSEMSPN